MPAPQRREATMQLRTFSASSMAEALVQVKREMGGDAVILHTRTERRRRWLGLRRVEVVGITAGNGLNMAGRGGARRARPQPAPVARSQTAGTLGALAASRGVVSRPAAAQALIPSRALDNSRQ